MFKFRSLRGWMLQFTCSQSLDVALQFNTLEFSTHLLLHSNTSLSYLHFQSVFVILPEPGMLNTCSLSTLPLLLLNLESSDAETGRN